jgi:hypothetical protein
MGPLSKISIMEYVWLLYAAQRSRLLRWPLAQPHVMDLPYRAAMAQPHTQGSV